MSEGRITLDTPLSFRTSFGFPLQSEEAKREVLIGALWLLVPVVGWMMNMGHRIVMVHHMHKGVPTWPAWTDRRTLLKHGAITFAGMAYYGSPGVFLMLAGWWWDQASLFATGLALWVAAVLAIPGYMTHYCKELDSREIFNPALALKRVAQGGRRYWHAWSIALSAMALSFLGLLGLGVGFLATSVWFWQVAGFSFATVFTAQLELAEPSPGEVASRGERRDDPAAQPSQT